MPFAPPPVLTGFFGLLTLALVAFEIGLVRAVAPPGGRRQWTQRAVLVGGAWLIGHAAFAESDLLASVRPLLPVYLVFNVATAVWFAASAPGRRLAQLPLGLLVGIHAFRLPLEVILHALYDADSLPVQMTWSGRNLDVITGAAALIIGLLSLRVPIPRWLVSCFNIMGLALLINVVTIALLSSPLPIRQFMNDPPVVLVFHAPYNWIVSVHVWTALTGHLLLFRALRHRTP